METNDPLEEFFRNKTEEFDPSYREEDWLELEKQLEIRDLKRRHRRRTGWLAAASILLLLSLGYTTLQNHLRINELSGLISQNEPVLRDLPPAASAESAPPSTSSETPGQQPSDDVEPAETALKDPPPADPQDESMGRYADPQVPHPADIAQRPDDTVRGEPVQPASFTAYRDLDEPKITGWLTIESISPPGIKHAEGVLRTEQDGQTPVLSSVHPARPDQPLRSRTAKATEKRGSGLSAGLTLSPDFSSVGGLSGIHQSGYKIGLTLEVDLGAGFALQSGVIPSRVHYRASGERQNAPVYWSGGIQPDEVTASCTILDLPLTLKYDLKRFDSSRLYVSAGLSSYYMIDEEYRFRYENQPQGALESWSDRTGTIHWFSNAGFSIGYELDLHPAWSMRAEPFLRLPVREVGWGGVRLYSMGSFVSLNYRF